MSFQSPLDLSSRDNSKGPSVASWLVTANENVLRDYLKLSESVPVLMLISQDGNPESDQLKAMLLKSIEAAKGRFAGIEVDLATSPALAQAVGVNQAPALIAILAGQPAPLFQGLISAEQLTSVLGQVLQLAAQNQISGTVTLAKTDPQAKPLSPEHQAAFDALDSGDFQAAKSAYEKILLNAPADQDAKAGLAQVEFLIRLQEDPGKSELEQLLYSADQQFASGDPDTAFTILLDAFANRIEDREEIRTRLLQLFVILGDSEQVVLNARRRLASLMF